MVGGEAVEIYPFFKRELYWEAQDIPLNIVYEDDYILVINKPYNLVVHPGNGIYNGTMLNALLHYFPPIIKIPRAGIVHRLDKNTTGLIIVAKTILAQTRLIELFKTRKIIKKYEAIVIGIMSTNSGIIEQPISRHVIKRTKMTICHKGKSAITRYRVMERFCNHTHIQLCIDTGRTHQIRVHMSHINHPLVGDFLYGGYFDKSIKKLSNELNKVLLSFNRQALHANFLRINHPITYNKMEWYIQLPQDMLFLIKALREDMKVSKKN